MISVEIGDGEKSSDSKAQKGWLLFKAIDRGDDEAIEDLLASGADPNAMHDGEPFLCRATAYGDLELVRKLLAAGGDPLIKGDSDEAAMHIAASFGYSEIVAEMAKELESRGRLREELEADYSSLGAAASEGRLETMRTLLKLGYDPNGNKRQSPMSQAAGSGAEAVRVLLEAGGSPNGGFGEYSTPLERAAWAVREDSVEALLDAGADVGKRGATSLSAISWAAVKGSPKIIEMLAAAGADLNENEKSGENLWTPLTHAIQNGRDEALAALLDCGAAAEIPDFTIRNGSLEIKFDKENHSIFGFAAIRESWGCVSEMLKRGLRPVEKDFSVRQELREMAELADLNRGMRDSLSEGDDSARKSRAKI